jgi:hypothetical protein
MFLLRLSHFKEWIVRGLTDAEWDSICRTLTGMRCLQ